MKLQEQYFAPQPTSARDLPDVMPLLHTVTLGALEAMAGTREIEQLMRWFSEDAYRTLLTRVNLAARARSARDVAPVRPSFHILRVRMTEPADGVVEAALVVTGPGRTRAVAMRLEGLDRRWRVTSMAVL